MKRAGTEIIASKAISNTAAIAIYEIEPHGEFITFAYCDGQKQGNKKRALIRYSSKGAYFITAGHREYISEYVKC